MTTTGVEYPRAKELKGKTIVIKYGGAALDDVPLRPSFCRDVILMQYVGIQPIIGMVTIASPPPFLLFATKSSVDAAGVLGESARLSKYQSAP